MGRMTFPTLWRKWIKECVCMATTSVLVNGLTRVNGGLVEHNLFMGYSVGELALVSVSHLQFADDTLLIWAKSWANVCALRVVLVLFETMSGLKVNFNKSILVGVNIFASWLGEATFAL
ncbi:cysteine-rich receptor-like protein kinase [Trifolium medium]|uniref:Cysteine-rich receptor-like protein kinase n=1 Tax=Trifolium medium TaxID=97028 RepID=A0A392MZF6_9FABA|nr:cysteine-rich receptor-like protein kinase [Trifolium medium]